MLWRWRTEVLNYWRCPLTNAVVEGYHHLVAAQAAGIGYIVPIKHR
jgi:hypothetical protein